MRFAQLVKAHGRRYRHTVVALDGVTDMSARITGDVAIEYRALTFNKRDLWRNLLLFHKTLSDVAADVLVTYNWGAIEWALANRLGRSLRHIHIEDGFGPEEATRQLRRRVWTRRIALSGRHTTVVLPSRGLERLARSVWRLPRIVYIPNGIDCTRFSPAPTRNESETQALVVGSLATLRKEKNIPRLIAMFCALAEKWPKGALQLLIVGDGPEMQNLQQITQASPYAGQIRLVGGTKEPEAWYPRMDIFALSSDTEQMPFSVLEAMATALPIVSTAVGDIPDLLSPINAQFVVAPQDESAFRTALASLLGDATLRRTLGEANRLKALAEFDERVMAARYADVFG